MNDTGQNIISGCLYGGGSFHPHAMGSLAEKNICQKMENVLLPPSIYALPPGNFVTT
jgi:hypothetical protein